MAQFTYEKKSITLEIAEKMLEVAERKAREIGVPMCIAVVDESGNLKAFSCMDGATLLSVGITQDKAYTAVAFSMATDEWYPFIKDDPPLLVGVPHIPRLTTLGGGYPIQVSSEIVGGIGVSGGAYSQDMEVAKAALGALK